MLDLEVVHGYLSRSYWAAGVPEDVVRRSIENSLCFGVYRGEEQAGFARVVTDRATFAYQPTSSCWRSTGGEASGSGSSR